MAEGIMAELGQSVTGNVESALLRIEDDRPDETRTKQRVKPGIFSTVSDGLKAVAKATKNKTIIDLSKKVLSQTAKVQENDHMKTFQVQFNPSELAIYGRCPEEVLVKNAQAAGANGTGAAPLNPNFIELNLNLIFDHVNIYDAFLFDKMTMGVSASGVTNAVSGVTSSAGKTWSVQPEVEGLLAALNNPQTRKVTFKWNDFTFEGLLNDVIATYTMFSVSGRPIRAKVELRIRQDLSEETIIPWTNDFDAAFSDPGPGSGNPKDKSENNSSSYVRTQQKMGSLLNLDL